MESPVTQAQYSLLVATVIGSAVIPTLIANAFYLPHHLIPGEGDVELEGEEMGIGRWKRRPRKKGAVGAST